MINYLATKAKLPNHSYQTKHTKPFLPNQTFQIKSTKPNLPNKPNENSLPNKTF